MNVINPGNSPVVQNSHILRSRRSVWRRGSPAAPPEVCFLTASRSYKENKVRGCAAGCQGTARHSSCGSCQQKYTHHRCPD